MEKLELSDYLERIASALEASNEITRQWIETQSRWRDEDLARMNVLRGADVARIEAHTAMEAEWIEWQEKHHAFLAERDQERYEQQLAREKEWMENQSRVLIEAFLDRLDAEKKMKDAVGQ